MAITPKLLAPSVVNGMVSEIYAPGNPLSKYFKMGIKGENVTTSETRSYSYDIVNNRRDLPNAVVPGTTPSPTRLQPIGQKAISIPQFYEFNDTISYEMLNQIRKLGENAGTLDKRGVTYLKEQSRLLKQKQENIREFMIAALLTTGSFGLKFSGNFHTPVLSLGSDPGYTYDFQIPSGNKSTAVPGLDPLGEGNIIDASWATTSTDIPLHLHKINLAFQRLVGAPMVLAVTDSIVWNAVMNNTKMQAQGGSVNSVFADYERTDLKGPDGNNLGCYRAKLRAIPWLEWLIYDSGLEVDGTYTQWFGGNKAAFMIQPESWWLRMVECKDTVKENYSSSPVDFYGTYFWLHEKVGTAGYELHSLQSVGLELRLPSGMMLAKVIG